MIIGAHVSISGGIFNSITNAQRLGCETFQIFTKNQNQWKEKYYSDAEIGKFRKTLEATTLKFNYIASHNSYLINLCSSNTENLQKSKMAFLNEINRCFSLGIPYLIFHPGSHLGQGEQRGLQLISESLQWAIEQSADSSVKLLLETTAGQGTNLGYRFEQLHSIIEQVNSHRIGVCVDTCHIFAAGYDIRNDTTYKDTINKLEHIIGLQHIKAFHLNDSKKELGSKIDRHQKIGEGFIGTNAFRFIMNDDRFGNIPGFLEIPGGDEAFIENINLLKSFRE